MAPANPVSVVSQRELAWTSAFTLDVPAGGRTASVFFGMTFDVPVAYSAESFTPSPDGAVLSDLNPGVRIGVMLGASGVFAR